MSFFRNIRSTISRGKSSSRDTTPVRNSRPSSIIGGSTIGGRRDSLDSHTDSHSVLNRSDTFILGDELTDKSATNSNCSTLEKKSKKSKVFGKFSTFTKRKKTPSTSSGHDDHHLEHHPSDNATNTYYNWQCDGGLAIDYDAQTDPFNFLYEQQSTLKALQHQVSVSASSNVSRTNSFSSSSPSPKEVVRPSFDSSTYRKNSKNLANYPLKEQLEQLKSISNNDDFIENDQLEEESEKYKTITLNSFRKSFQDHYLQQQELEQQQQDQFKNEALQKPAWFVKVDTPRSHRYRDKEARDLSREAKENRADYFVFANENYRPGSKSPVREERQSRSKTRSPIKRNETFKIENSHYDDENPSIQIAFRNAITSQTPIARIVPVGVAKPMPTTNYYKQRLAATSTNQNLKPNLQVTKTKTNKSPIRNFFSRSNASSPSPTPLRHKVITNPSQNGGVTGGGGGRFQTLVHINNDQQKSNNYSHHSNGKALQARSSTKVHLGSSNPIPMNAPQTLKMKSTPHNDYHNSYGRLSYANISGSHPKSYEIDTRFLNSNRGHGNFVGATHMAATISSANKRQTVPFGAGYITTPVQTKPSQYQSQGRSPNSSLYLGHDQHLHQYQQPNQHQNFYQPQQNLQTQKQHSALHQQQANQQSSPASQKSRIMVSMQRRSRSPIKMPWR